MAKKRLKKNVHRAMNRRLKGNKTSKKALVSSSKKESK
jgi:hypothetical protein